MRHKVVAFPLVPQTCVVLGVLTSDSLCMKMPYIKGFLTMMGEIQNLLPGNLSGILTSEKMPLGENKELGSVLYTLGRMLEIFKRV